MSAKSVPVLVGALLCASSSLQMARATDSKCDTLSTSETVAIVVCPASSTKEDWEKAGVAACGQKRQCNAWIWDNRNLAPRTAPATNAEIDKAIAAAAKAVWVNEDRTMILVRKVK